MAHGRNGMAKNREQRIHKDRKGVRQTCHKHVRYGHGSTPADQLSVGEASHVCLDIRRGGEGFKEIE